MKSRRRGGEKKVSENNGQLCFVRHHGHSYFDPTKKNVGEKMTSFASSATTGGARKHAWTENVDGFYSQFVLLHGGGPSCKLGKKGKK